MKQILIIGLVFLTLISSTFALTFDGVNVTSGTSNTTISFNTPITADTMTINNESIYLTNIVTPGCYAVTDSYNFTGANTTYLSSGFYSLFNCAEVNYQLQYDDNISAIIVLSIALFLLLGIGFDVGNFIPEEYKKYVVWMFIAIIAAICVRIMFYT